MTTKEKTIIEGNKASTEQYAAMVNDMRAYEQAKGALPPGAKASLPPGTKPADGGGQMNHSTNLQLKQPAGFGYVNITTGGEDAVSESGTATGGASANKKARTPTANANGKALKDLNKLQGTFQTMMDRLLTSPTALERSTPSRLTPSEITIDTATNKRKRKLNNKLSRKRQKKKELMDQIEFLEPRKDDNLDYYNGEVRI